MSAWKPPETKHCDRCGKTIKGTSSLRKHKSSKECQAIWNRKRVDQSPELAFVERDSVGRFILDVCTMANVPGCERDVLYRYRKGAYGRQGHEEKRHVAPRWVAALLVSGPSAFEKVTAPNGTKPTIEQTRALCAIVIGKARTDLEYRKLLEAACALDGSRALFAFGIELAKEREAAKRAEPPYGTGAFIVAREVG